MPVTGGSQQDQIVYLLQGAVLAILVLREFSSAVNSMISDPLLLFISTWCMAAALIAPRKESTLYVVVVLLMMMAYLLQRQSTNERTLHTFALAATVSMVPSIVGRFIPVAGVPAFYQAGSAGGFAGYFQFNSSAGACAAVTLLAIATLLTNHSFAWWYPPAIAFGLLLLTFSKSATSIICFAAGLGVLSASRAWHRTSARLKPLITLSTGALVIVGLMFFGDKIAVLPTLAAATGRDEKLTNRTDIWRSAQSGITEAPLWGHGSGFWRASEWTSAQNGFLEFALIVGIPAAAALALLTIRTGYRIVATSSPMLGLWTFGVLFNLSVSQLIVPTVTSLALWAAIASTQRSRGTPPATQDVRASVTESKFIVNPVRS